MGIESGLCRKRVCLETVNVTVFSSLVLLDRCFFILSFTTFNRDFHRNHAQADALLKQRTSCSNTRVPYWRHVCRRPFSGFTAYIDVTVLVVVGRFPFYRTNDFGCNTVHDYSVKNLHARWTREKASSVRNSQGGDRHAGHRVPCFIRLLSFFIPTTPYQLKSPSTALTRMRGAEDAKYTSTHSNRTRARARTSDSYRRIQGISSRRPSGLTTLGSEYSASRHARVRWEPDVFVLKGATMWLKTYVGKVKVSGHGCLALRSALLEELHDCCEGEPLGGGGC